MHIAPVIFHSHQENAVGMRRRRAAIGRVPLLMAGALAALALATPPAGAQVDTRWPQHSMDRPQPPVVDPGPYVAERGRPADAVVLFDGHDLSQWRDDKGGPAKWTLGNGYFQVAPGTGTMRTAQAFGDVQLHIEWRAPTPARGEGQERGNSGVFLQGLYEVQVLDSYHSTTYPDGQAGSIYGQFPPLVNPARPPGQWNVYDIIFHRPRFDASGAVTAPARFTVFMNGVLVQDNVALSGPTANKVRPPYEKTLDRLPLGLQDHGDLVRYRNIWIRELPDQER
ncbi:MAG: 3-keto-disaccharide hydrolase [Gemmatimonadaceae bacterium]